MTWRWFAGVLAGNTLIAIGTAALVVPMYGAVVSVLIGTSISAAVGLWCVFWHHYATQKGRQ